MGIKVQCTHCGARYGDVAEELAGRTVVCKKCQRKFRIEQASTRKESSPPEPLVGATTSEGPAHWGVGDVILNLYEVTALLGEGGMGTVHKVRHRGWNLDLAVKSPRPEILARAGGAANFEREAETWVNLGLHPHTVSCYYVRRVGGVPRVFAEFVEGGSLADWIRSGRLYEGGKDLALARMIDAAVQFAWGLHYAHENGLIHQDVKPANVMMTVDGTAKVTDFGLARAKPMEAAAAGGAGQTLMADKAGMTPAYASPEQLAGQKLTRRTDLWSWGLSLLEMFSGDVTWAIGGVAAGALEAYLDENRGNGPIPAMPEKLAALLRRCFEPDPADRPHDMAEAAAILTDLYQETAGRAYPRPEPRAGRSMAADLNNRAVSLLDLGKTKEARDTWTAALKTDPHHLESTYNLALLQWRSSSVTDEEVRRRLAEIGRSHGDSQRFPRLMGALHLYFGDYSEAVESLRRSVDRDGHEIEALRDLGLALVALAGSGKDAKLWTEAEDVLGRVQAAGHTAPAVAVARALVLKNLGRIEASAALYAESRSNYKDLPSSLTEAAAKFLPGFEAEIEAAQPDAGLALSFSPDGTKVFSASRERIRTWDSGPDELRNGNEAKLRGPVPEVGIFSRDGRYFFSAAAGEPYLLWDVANGRPVKHTRVVQSRTHSLALNRNGKNALTGGTDRIVRLWDMETGELVREMAGHEAYVSALAFSPDEKLALSGGGDKTLRIWSMETGEEVRALKGHRGTVTAALFHPGGEYILSASEDRTLRLWDPRGGTCRKVLAGHAGSVTRVAFDPKGRYALSAGDDGTLRVWDLKTGAVANLFRFGRRIEALAVHPAGKRALIATAQPDLPGWRFTMIDYLNPERYSAPYVVSRPVSASEADALDMGFRSKIEEAARLAESGDFTGAFGRLVDARSLIGFERHAEAVKEWDRLGAAFPFKELRSVWQQAALEGHGDAVNAISVAGCGNRVLSCGRDGVIRNWDTEKGLAERTLTGHQGQVTAISADKAGRTALSGGSDKTVRIWDLESGECRRTLTGHTDFVTAVAIGPTGKYGISAARDNTCRLWDLRTGAGVQEFEGYESYVAAVAFGPDERFAITGGMDRTVRMWDLSTGGCLQVLEGHSNHVAAVAVSGDGLYAVSGSDDGSVKRWSLKTGELLRSYSGHRGPVTAVDVSPDGKYAVSAGRDRSLILWDLRTGRQTHKFEGHSAEVYAAAFSADGRVVISGGLDKTVRVWRLDWLPDIVEPTSFDEGARPYLEIFLTLQTPVREGRFFREGKAQWDKPEFADLMKNLGRRGYGHLTPAGVAGELEKMNRTWRGPTPVGQKYAVKLREKPWWDNPVLLFPLKYWKPFAVLFTVVFLGMLLYLMIPSRPPGPDGFRDAKLDMNLADVGGLTPVEKDQVYYLYPKKLEIYERPGDDLTADGTALNGIHYLFENEKLQEIRLLLADGPEADQYHYQLEMEYGRGRQFMDERNGLTGFYWSWKDEKLVVALVHELEYSSETYVLYRRGDSPFCRDCTPGPGLDRTGPLKKRIEQLDQNPHSPIPNPQSLIPNRQSSIVNRQ